MMWDDPENYSEKSCFFCADFVSYYASYFGDPYEPIDVGECYNDLSSKDAVSFEDTCDMWNFWQCETCKHKPPIYDEDGNRLPRCGMLDIYITPYGEVERGVEVRMCKNFKEE